MENMTPTSAQASIVAVLAVTQKVVVVRRSVVVACLIVLVSMAACSSESPAAPEPTEENPAPVEEVYQLQQQVAETMELSSASIKDTGHFDRDFTCEGADLSPQLSWSGVPDDTKSLAIVAQDLDGDTGVIALWLVWGIPPEAVEIDAEASGSGTLPAGSTQGTNGSGTVGWNGPCPPPRFIIGGSRTGATGLSNTGFTSHNYVISIYALDTDVSLDLGAARDDLLGAIDGHIIASGSVSPKYLSKNTIRR